MGKIVLSGTLMAGPPDGSTQFPASQYTVPLAFKGGTELTFGVATGILSRTLNSPSPAFAALQGVGSTDTVTRGQLLYFKSDSPVTLRITTDDGAGAPVVELVPVDGLLIRQFQDTKFLRLLEAQGSGRLEYFVSGQQ